MIYSTVFGIRTLRFDKDTGFYLNGKPYKIWGQMYIRITQAGLMQ